MASQMHVSLTRARAHTHTHNSKECGGNQVREEQAQRPHVHVFFFTRQRRGRGQRRAPLSLVDSRMLKTLPVDIALAIVETCSQLVGSHLHASMHACMCMFTRACACGQTGQPRARVSACQTALLNTDSNTRLHTMTPQILHMPLSPGAAAPVSRGGDTPVTLSLSGRGVLGLACDCAWDWAALIASETTSAARVIDVRIKAYVCVSWVEPRVAEVCMASKQDECT